jgi:glycosyl transferase family 25
VTPGAAASRRPGGPAAAFAYLKGWADRIFVVTLARAHERHAHIEGVLGGLDFRFHRGVDKASLDLAALEREGRLAPWREVRRLTGKPRPLKPGEAGAALSHRQVYEEIVGAGVRRAIVLEDDVAPREHDVALLPAALDQLPEDWDLVYLGYTRFERVTTWQRAKRLLYRGLAPLHAVPWRPEEAVRLHPRPFSANLRRAGYHDGAYAYAVSLAGARKLLAAQTPLAHVADHLVLNLVLSGELRAFVTEPKMFDELSDRIAGPASYAQS